MFASEKNCEKAIFPDNAAKSLAPTSPARIPTMQASSARSLYALRFFTRISETATAVKMPSASMIAFHGSAKLPMLNAVLNF